MNGMLGFSRVHACMHAWGNRGKEVGIYLNESIHAVVTAGKGKLCRAAR